LSSAKQPRRPKKTLRVHKRIQQPQEILVNQMIDNLKFPEMVFNRQLPLPKPEANLKPGQSRVLKNVGGLTHEFFIVNSADESEIQQEQELKAPVVPPTHNSQSFQNCSEPYRQPEQKMVNV